MRSVLVSLLALATFTRAQDSILGTYFTPADDDNSKPTVVPDVSVIGESTITDSGNGDVGFMTIQTIPNPTTTQPAYVCPLVFLRPWLCLSLAPLNS
jgi:hypothetical protein